VRYFARSTACKVASRLDDKKARMFGRRFTKWEDRLMHGRRGSSFASTFVRIAFVAVLVSGLSAQVGEHRRRAGLPEDWSHHHVKFNTAKLRQHPEIASREPRAAFQLYREAQAALARFAANRRRVARPSAVDRGMFFSAAAVWHLDNVPQNGHSIPLHPSHMTIATLILLSLG
jgi:hypothetical protein